MKRMIDVLLLGIAPLTGCEFLSTAPNDPTDAEVNDEWSYTSSSSYTFPGSAATTYCSASAVASIDQTGRTFQGRLNGLSSCEARGIRFADAITHRIDDGAVLGKGIRFKVRGCLHEGGLLRDDDDVILGKLHPDTCDGWSGEFRMERRQ